MTQLDVAPAVHRSPDPSVDPRVERLLERYLAPGPPAPLVPPPSPRRRSATKVVLALLLLATAALAGLDYAKVRNQSQSTADKPKPRPSASTAGRDIDPLTALPAGVLRVPWINATLRPSDNPEQALTLPSAVGTARTCRRADVRLHIRVGPAAGTDFAQLLVQNTSTSACQLLGRPGVRLLDSRGRVVRRSRFDSGGGGTAIVLVPRSWAVSELGAVAVRMCGSTRSDRIFVVLPSGGGLIAQPLALGGPALDSRACARPVNYRGVPLEVTPFGPTPNPVVPGVATSPVTALTATVLLPAESRAGQQLRYVVLLSNPTAYEVPISGYLCPTYHQELLARGRFSGDWLLNCAGAGGSIAPNAAVAFDMVLAVPPGAGPAPGTVSWAFSRPQGLIAVAHLRVT
ncbi:MAG: DUF4232 domain-containing protein [Mycobacteriales bacterium]